MGLTKARIEVLDLEAIQPGRLPQFLDVQFNPTEYTLAKGAQIAEIGIYGIDSPVLQFVRGQNQRLTLEFYFDTTESGLGDDATDVTGLTDPFFQLVKMQPGTHAPPRIRFTWGSLNFKAIVENVQQRFTLFNPAGKPLRATLQVTFREYKTLEEQLSELKLESADHSKRYEVKSGDTLSGIAAREYGDSRQWRVIADRNPELRDVRRLEPGTVLIVPPLEDFRQL
jgi:hypothetical protein